MSLSIKNSCGGKSLPELTNPATASDIASGKQAIDGDGNIITGEGAMCVTGNVTATSTSEMTITNLSNYSNGIIYVKEVIEGTGNFVLSISFSDNGLISYVNIGGNIVKNNYVTISGDTITLSDANFFTLFNYNYILWNE